MDSQTMSACLPAAALACQSVGPLGWQGCWGARGEGRKKQGPWLGRRALQNFGGLNNFNLYFYKGNGAHGKLGGAKNIRCFDTSLTGCSLS